MSDENEDQSRTAGVAFGPLKRALREHRYPVSVAELVEQYGGFELEAGGEAEPLEKTLERCERTRFHEPREVRDAILRALGTEAVREEAAGESGSDESGPDESERGTGADGERGAEGEKGDAAGADDWSRLST